MAQTTTTTTNRELDLRHVWHGNLQHRDLESKPPLEIVRGEGCCVYDAEGNHYIDAMAGLFCVNAGYGRRPIVDAMSATGQILRKQAFEPLVPGFYHVPPPDHYRCGWCNHEPGCTLACADEVERVIRMEGPETVAAVIAEPTIGGGGIFPAPEG